MASAQPITIDDLNRVTREAIKELVPGMIQGLTTKVDGLTVRLDDLTTRVDSLNEGLDSLTTKVDNLTVRVDGLTHDVQVLTTRVDGLTANMHGLTVRVDSLADNMEDVRASVYRLEVLSEDFDERMKADGELLRKNLNVRDQVRGHETRLKKVESLQTILKSTVRDHSRQLKST